MLSVKSTLTWGVGLLCLCVSFSAGWSIRNHDFQAYKAEISLKEKDYENAILSLNLKVQVQYEQNLKTVDSYKRQLASNKLRDPYGTVCNTSSPSSSTISSTAGELSEEFAGFLRGESYRADEITSYAQACYLYIKNLQSLSSQ